MDIQNTTWLRQASKDTVPAIVEWLSGNECHDLDDAGLVAGLGRRLRAAGLPVDRLALHLRTLHPSILGRTVAWAPREPIEIHDREHGVMALPDFADSPLRHVMETGEAVLVRTGSLTDRGWTQMDVFRQRGLTELFVAPLSNADGPVSAVSFCTAQPQGFLPTHLESLERVLPALRNVCELRVLRQTELTLLDTYIGTATAKRILAGRIRRGQVETLEAALMLCDLRGFTALSNRLANARILALLNSYFDCVVPAITAAGGDVLKFMGDAVLAFFQDEDAARSCAAAFEGARGVLENLNQFASPEGRLEAGIALHYGEVSYGNIGSTSRLDFTVIGSDVNLVSRIQGVCSKTGQRLLASKRFAMALDTSGLVPIGAYDLAGFTKAEELFALDEPAPQGLAKQ